MYTPSPSPGYLALIKFPILRLISPMSRRDKWVSGQGLQRSWKLENDREVWFTFWFWDILKEAYVIILN